MTRRNATSFWNGPDGAVIRWKCSCGHEGFLDHTGSHADDTNVNCPAGNCDEDADATDISTNLAASAAQKEHESTSR